MNFHGNNNDYLFLKYIADQFLNKKKKTVKKNFSDFISHSCIQPCAHHPLQPPITCVFRENVRLWWYQN